MSQFLSQSIKKSIAELPSTWKFTDSKWTRWNEIIERALESENIFDILDLFVHRSCGITQPLMRVINFSTFPHVKALPESLVGIIGHQK